MIHLIALNESKDEHRVLKYTRCREWNIGRGLGVRFWAELTAEPSCELSLGLIDEKSEVAREIQYHYATLPETSALGRWFYPRGYEDWTLDLSAFATAGSMSESPAS